MINTKSHVYVVPQTAESDQLIYILINFIFIFKNFNKNTRLMKKLKNSDFLIEEKRFNQIQNSICTKYHIIFYCLKFVVQ